VPVKLGVDPPVIGVRHPGQQRGHRGEPARRAVTALQRTGLQPGLLRRVQDAVLSQALDRDDPLPGDAGCVNLAGLHGPAAHEHRAGTACALTAAGLGPGDLQVIPQQLKQALPGPLGCLVGLTVDDDRE